MHECKQKKWVSYSIRSADKGNVGEHRAENLDNTPINVEIIHQYYWSLTDRINVLSITNKPQAQNFRRLDFTCIMNCLICKYLFSPF